jgi:hypothetical protein
MRPELLKPDFSGALPPCVTQRIGKPVRNREAGAHPLI